MPTTQKEFWQQLLKSERNMGSCFRKQEAAAYQDVGRLDVAMDHRELRVQVVERADHLEQRIG